MDDGRSSATAWRVSAWSHSLLLALAVFSGCGSSPPASGGGATSPPPAEGDRAPRADRPAPSAPEAEPEGGEAAAPEPAVEVRPLAPLSPFTPAMVERLRAIRAVSDRRQDDVFMKVGDSSTVSRGFLECFAEADEVALDGRDELGETIAFFGQRHAGGRDSYRRTSLAAAEGWSARQVLEGRPSPLLREVRAIRPRFAFVMNGGNDVEGHNDYTYATRMLRIVEILEENGVIPVLNSLPPRADDADADAWAQRYNQISWAVARAHRLPYLDYRQVMEALPRRGLAGDGVHPNIFVEGNRGHACQLTEEGLQFGHNARNLLAIRALDALRRTVVAGEDAPAPAEPPVEGDATVSAPRAVRALPFAELVDTRTDGSSELERYSCGEQVEGGREVVYRLVIDAPLRLRALAVGRQDADVDVHLLRGEPTEGACVERADREIVRALEPGTWYVAVDTFSGDGEPRAGEVLVLLAPAPPETSSPAGSD